MGAGGGQSGEAISEIADYFQTTGKTQDKRCLVCELLCDCVVCVLQEGRLGAGQQWHRADTGLGEGESAGTRGLKQGQDGWPG